MLAIGASSRGGGRVASRSRAFWNVSSQFTSGASRVTWTMFQTTPDSRTSRMSEFSSGLLEKAVSSAPDSSTGDDQDGHQEHHHAEEIGGGPGHRGGRRGGCDGVRPGAGAGGGPGTPATTSTRSLVGVAAGGAEGARVDARAGDARR